jgi:hypothetical protein
MHEQIMPYSLKAIIQALSSILPELSSHWFRKELRKNGRVISGLIE